MGYILLNKKWNNSTLNCEAYSFFEGIFSDHRIVNQRYDWAQEGMWPEPPQPYTMIVSA